MFALVLLLVAGTVIAVWHFRREQQPTTATPTVVPAVTCSARLLSADERRQRARILLQDKSTTYPDMPDELADNPMVFSYLSAVVKIENPTAALLHFHDCSGYGPLHPDRVFLLGVELFDAAGRKVSLTPEQEEYLSSLRSVLPITVPTAAELAEREKPRLYEVPAGGSVELRVDILDEWSRVRFGLKPGTYTSRVTVSFCQAPAAGAPTGEARQVVCAPVTVTVTAEHIKQAKAYWKIPE